MCKMLAGNMKLKLRLKSMRAWLACTAKTGDVQDHREEDQPTSGEGLHCDISTQQWSIRA